MMELDILSRRKFIGSTLSGAAAFGAVMATTTSIASASRLALPDTGAFEISFRNQHTGEKFSGVYRVGDKYLPKAFHEINYVLRDFRKNEIFPIDPRVIDILYVTRRKLGTDRPYEILSGYRCPRTNAMLQRNTSGVAKNSLHMTGQAIDLRLPGHSLKGLRNTAQSLRAGGVGYYPKSHFIHVDTGRIRTW